MGHGSSYISDQIDELIAVDMGCIGLDLDCSESDVSICASIVVVHMIKSLLVLFN